MRKLLLTTAAVAAAIGLAGCGNGDPNTLIDKRDGQKYRTVMIGGDRWMAQNLNYETDSSWCYENNADSCNKYGRLYNWNAAKKACPIGYHLSSHQEWVRLADTSAYIQCGTIQWKNTWPCADEILKAKNGWRGNNSNGTDALGFSALPGGVRVDSSGCFERIGNAGVWWTATMYGNNFWNIYLTSYYNNELGEDYTNKSNGFSVRCIADKP